MDVGDDVKMSSVAALIKAILRWVFTVIARPGSHGAHGHRVNGFSRFNRNTRLGRNFNTNGIVVHGSGRVDIGDNFHSGSNVKIYTSSHNYDGTMVPYDRALNNYAVVIESQVWLGSDVTIVGNVHIGEGAIIQVGSVVSSSIPRYAIAGGNPARVFKSRNVELYERNKSEGRFH